MKILKQLALILTIFSCSALYSSCNFIDISDELSDNLDIEEVFNNPSYTKKWYNEMYRMIPKYSEMGLGASNYKTGIWSIIAGEVTTAKGPGRNYMTSGFNASSADFNKWWNGYIMIRQALIFLDRVKPLGISGTDKEAISEEQVNRMKSEAKYLMAYTYFQLFELYGPVPIVSEIQNPEDKNLDYPRASVDEVVQYIDDLLVDVIESEHIPKTINTGKVGNDYEHNNDRFKLKEMLRPTIIAAKALRARLWVYAASPLFNGGYQEALSIKNHDGKLLFPEYDANKWVIAKTHLEELLDFAEQNGFELYKAKPDENGDVDPNESIYELFQYYNNEIIWATGDNNFNHVNLDMEPRTAPRDIADSQFGNVGVFQEGVDLFFMDNGLLITDPNSGYDPTGFQDYPNVTRTDKRIDKHINTMFVNREPRFYNTITYEGRSWHIDPRAKYTVHFSKGGGADSSMDENPRTGYMLYKFKNRTLINKGDNNKQWGRPWILFRLADFYLYYAEVCNEIDPSDPNIIKYLDLVRERAGIPGYNELATSGLKNIIGDQELQREAIRHERRVELYAEGNRYFDIRRWMTADDLNSPDQQVVMTGLDMSQAAAEFDKGGIPIKFYDKVGIGSFYNKTVIENRAWRRAMLLYPIPYNEMQKSEALVQNPLWD